MPHGLLGAGRRGALPLGGAAHEIRAIDIRKLRDAQKPDFQGNVIPAAASDGSVVWARMEDVPVTGRLVVMQRHKAIASNYTCGTGCPCPTNFVSLVVTCTGHPILVAGTDQHFSTETRRDCNQLAFYYDVTNSSSWTSSLPAIATVNNSSHKGLATGVSGGATSIRSSYTDYWYTYSSLLQDCVEHTRTFLPAAQTKVVSITGPQEVWWFNGQTPSGYATTITLTALPSGASSYSWSLVAGASKAALQNQSGNTIQLRGTALSTAQNDVTVQVGVTFTGGTTYATRTATVRGPKTLTAGAPDDSCNSAYGYDSYLNYTIQDNLGALMPSSIPLNEYWTSPVVNEPAYPNANWRRQEPPGSLTSTDSTFADQIGGEYFSLPANPTPTCPPPLGSTAVQHWGQEWRVGSLTPGRGARVQTDKIQKYLDHARHTNIQTPAP